jgi:hypothetical protein
MITDGSFFQLYGNIMLASTAAETEWRENKKCLEFLRQLQGGQGHVYYQVLMHWCCWVLPLS